MNRFKKPSIIILTVLVTIAVQFSMAKIARGNPIEKLSEINSMTSKTEVSMKLSASGLSNDEQLSMAMVSSILNDMKLSTTTQLNMNADNTKLDEYTNMTANIGGMPIDMGLWAKMDLTSKTPTMREIIKIPSIISGYLPEGQQSKEYAVLDLGAQSSNKLDLKELTKVSDKLAEAITNSLTTLKLEDIKDKGLDTIKSNGKTISVHNYTIKLDDLAFKQLVKSLGNKMISNKDVITAIKDYIRVVGKASGEDNDKLSKEMDKSTPKFLEEFNKAMDEAKNVKLIGDKGFVINYSVNNDGYIVNLNGVLDIVIDGSTIGEVPKLKNMNGTYKLLISFNTDMYDINRNIKIDFPKLDKNNSFDISEPLKNMDIPQL